LIVHREERLRSLLLSVFLFFVHFFFMHLPLLTSSTPKMPSPRNAQQKKRKKSIEGYINSYIQKSKKEAKARRNKKQNGERG
jgi:hypothetical protein